MEVTEPPTCTLYKCTKRRTFRVFVQVERFLSGLKPVFPAPQDVRLPLASANASPYQTRQIQVKDQSGGNGRHANFQTFRTTFNIVNSNTILQSFGGSRCRF